MHEPTFFAGHAKNAQITLGFIRRITGVIFHSAFMQAVTEMTPKYILRTHATHRPNPEIKTA
jgi:hypothetical protein